jgi:hypothetical protein
LFWGSPNGSLCLRLQSARPRVHRPGLIDPSRGRDLNDGRLNRNLACCCPRKGCKDAGTRGCSKRPSPERITYQQEAFTDPLVLPVQLEARDLLATISLVLFNRRVRLVVDELEGLIVKPVPSEFFK